ncbi:MAG: GNAT family N-acetyltransferase [Bacteroidaceae bacterium]|nr:GNAT family N-acetyltransferase [Bacteroidaceae bacterium]
MKNDIINDNTTYDDGIVVMVADASHEAYVDTILETIADSARKRGSGIATRTHEYLATKMRERKAIIALAGPEREFAGFCYIESWGNKSFVANSGLIVVEKFRKHHLATRIKRTAFTLSRIRWPHAKLFGLTSQAAVMKINTSLGYVPVTFAELTDDEAYWRGCGTPEHPCCQNFDILQRTGRKYCICTGMLYDPADHVGEPLPVQLPDDVIEFCRHLNE